MNTIYCTILQPVLLQNLHELLFPVDAFDFLLHHSIKVTFIIPFAPGDFAEKHVLKLVEWFSGHCRAIKS